MAAEPPPAEPAAVDDDAKHQLLRDLLLKVFTDRQLLMAALMEFVAMSEHVREMDPDDRPVLFAHLTRTHEQMHRRVVAAMAVRSEERTQRRAAAAAAATRWREARDGMDE